jgi:ABC-2 type transport system permease protein
MTRPAHPPLPGFARATLWMASLYRRTLMRGRKTWIVALLLLVGLIFAVAVGRLEGLRRVQGYESLMGQLVLGFLVQFAALFYGTAVVREEVESRTLTYLIVRPLPRASVVLGRWLTATALVAVVVVGFSVAGHLIAVPGEALARGAPERLVQLILSGEAGAVRFTPPSLAQVVLASGLSAIYYTTVFTAIAVLLPRPFLFGLGYIVFWEFALPLVPNAAATLSLKFHAMNLAGLELSSGLPLFRPPDVAPATSAAVFVVATVVLLAVSLYAFPRKEYATARAE